jgi:hypothetical protein
LQWPLPPRDNGPAAIRAVHEDVATCRLNLRQARVNQQFAARRSFDAVRPLVGSFARGMTTMPRRDSAAADHSKRGAPPAAKSAVTRFSLRPGEIRDLYETARSLGGIGGAPYLNRLFDAETALASGMLDRVRQILTMTRQEFEKSHARLLRFRPDEGEGRGESPKEQKRLLARKEQIEAVLAQFDECLAVSQRMADRAERTRAEVDRVESRPSASAEAPALPAGFRETFLAEESTDAQLQVVARHFECARVETSSHIAPGSLYFLRTKRSGYLLRTSHEPAGDAVSMTDVLTGQSVRPQTLEALIEQGKKGKLFALATRKAGTPRNETSPAPAAQSSPPDPLEAQNALLDRQLFNVLMTSVRNSGLDVSTDLIVQIRDNEFRKGEFHDAFEKLNQLATRYEVAAARRKEELRRHDQWLASGQSGLSMREVEEAKLKNAQERTRLEHASHRFGLVVEPLRILSRGSEK